MADFKILDTQTQFTVSYHLFDAAGQEITLPGDQQVTWTTSDPLLAKPLAADVGLQNRFQFTGKQGTVTLSGVANFNQTNFAASITVEVDPSAPTAAKLTPVP